MLRATQKWRPITSKDCNHVIIRNILFFFFDPTKEYLLFSSLFPKQVELGKLNDFLLIIRFLESNSVNDNAIKITQNIKLGGPRRNGMSKK